MGSRKKRSSSKKAQQPAPAPQAAPPKKPSSEIAVEDIDAIDIDLDADDPDIPKTKASRRAPRIAVDERVSISGFFGNGDREDRLRDASTQGVFVETAHPLDIGDPVVLHLPLDDEDGKKLRVSGRVRWVSPFGTLKDPRAGMGIELVGLSAEQKEALSAMLRRRTRGGG